MSKVSFEKLRKNNESLLEILIIKCLSNKRKNGKILWEKLTKKEFDPQNMDIQFSINGYEFPVVELFQQFQNQIDDLVKKEAVELIHEKFSDLDTMVCDLQIKIKEIAFERLGIKIEEDY